MKALLVVAAAVPILIACTTNPHKMWKETLAGCVGSERIGDDLLFLGTTNLMGPGSLLRLRQDDNVKKGYSVLYVSSDEIYKRTTFENSTIKCAGNAAKSFAFKPELVAAILPAAGDLNGSAAVDWARASRVTLSVKEATWVDLKEIDYRSILSSFPPDDPVRRDVTEHTRNIILGALRLNGYTVKLEFEQSVEPSVQAKYAGPLGKFGGELTPKVSGKWTSDSTLEISADESSAVFVLGSIGRFNLNSGFSTSDSGEAESIPPVDKNASLTLEPISSF